MTRIVTADGLIATAAYANAYAADRRMEGVRVELKLERGGNVRASVHPGDRDAMASWRDEDVEAMLAAMAQLARDNDIEMCDDREVNAWITDN